MTVGFTTGPILDDPEMRARGIDAIPSTPFEGQDWMGLTGALVREGYREMVAHPINPATGEPLDVPPPQMLTPQEANDRYGIDGTLKFDNEVPALVAQNLYTAKRDELAREDAARRAPAGFGDQVKRFGAGLVAGSLDPLNVASTFIPVVGEARYATMLAQAGGALGRAGIRAGVGAVQGAVGQAALEPLRYGLARSEQADYSATDALLNIAYGGIFGGGLHATLGAAGDVLGRRFRASPAAGIVEGDPEAREAALRTALAQLVEGRPVEVQPVLNAALQRRLMSSTSLTRPAGIPEDVLAERGEAPEQPAPASAPALDARPVAGAADEQGVVRIFDSQQEAERVQKRLAGRGDQVDVVPHGGGGFVLTRELEGAPLRSPDGTPLSFQTERAAQKFIDRSPLMQGRDLTVAPIGEAGARRFAVLEGASDRDLAALRARPDLADFGRTADRSAGALGRQLEAKRAAGLTATRTQALAAARDPRLAAALERAAGAPAPEEVAARQAADAAVKAERAGQAGAAAPAAKAEIPAKAPVESTSAQGAVSAPKAAAEGDLAPGRTPDAATDVTEIDEELRNALEGDPAIVAAREGAQRADSLARAWQQAAVCMMGKAA